MLYGIIYSRGNGKYAIKKRRFLKFLSRDEEIRLGPFIRTIIEEQTMYEPALDKKIAQYIRDNHLEMEMPIDILTNECAAMSDSERIKKLEMTIDLYALLVDQLQHRAWDLEYAHWCADHSLGSAEYVLDHNQEVLQIAITKFGNESISDAIEKATAEYEDYRRDHLH